MLYFSIQVLGSRFDAVLWPDALDAASYFLGYHRLAPLQVECTTMCFRHFLPTDLQNIFNFNKSTTLPFFMRLPSNPSFYTLFCRSHRWCYHLAVHLRASQRLTMLCRANILRRPQHPTMPSRCAHVCAAFSENITILFGNFRSFCSRVCSILFSGALILFLHLLLVGVLIWPGSAVARHSCFARA